MNLRLLIITQISCIVVSGILIKVGVNNGYSLERVYLIRGIFCLGSCLFYFIPNKDKVGLPSFKIQTLRLFLLGSGGYLILLSYQYIEPSSVELLKRLNIPILAIFGPLLGFYNSKKESFAYWLIFVAICITAFTMNAQDSSFAGYSLALSGSLLFGLSYPLFKMSTSKDHNFYTISVAALGSIAFGLIALYAKKVDITFSKEEIILSSGLGVMQFFMYYLGAHLYKCINIKYVEAPSFVSIIILLIVESFYLNKSIDIIYISSILIFGTLIFSIPVFFKRGFLNGHRQT
jgi:hypothetical protein